MPDHEKNYVYSNKTGYPKKSLSSNNNLFMKSSTSKNKETLFEFIFEVTVRL